MKLKISFPAGAYSAKKEEIKQIFKILDYKYQTSIKQNVQLVCIWKRKEDNKIIKGLFNGSGQPCTFIVDCNETEQDVFTSFTTYHATVSTNLDGTIDTEKLLQEAKRIVDSWFTWQKPYKNEPPLFYNKRIEKMNQSYNWFIERQIDKIKQTLPL